MYLKFQDPGDFDSFYRTCTSIGTKQSRYNLLYITKVELNL